MEVQEFMHRKPLKMNKYKHQQYLEEIFNKNQLIPRIIQDFKECKQFNFEAYMQVHNIPVKFGFSLLAQMVLHKRASLKTIVGCLRYHFTTAQEVVDMLYNCAICNLVDWDSNLRQFITVFNISKEVQAELDRYQFPLPMVVKPKYLKDNNQTGYINGKGSIILRNNHTNDDVCLDHINRINGISLCINDNTATMIKNSWKNLDRVKDGETKEDFEKRKKAFKKYDETCKDVMAIMNQEGNEFHLTHAYDKRGRTYCRGYHISYQGNPWNKAVIEFTEKEYI